MTIMSLVNAHGTEVRSRPNTSGGVSDCRNGGFVSAVCAETFNRGTGLSPSRDFESLRGFGASEV